jgi:hypothetical protein
MLSWAAAACTDDATACGGPTSDFPVCSEDDDPDDLVSGGNSGGGAGADHGGGDASLPGTVDAGCELAPVCEGAASELDVEGTTPYGSVTFERIALAYVTSGGPATELKLEGRLADGPAQLTLRLAATPDAENPGNPVVSPGTYVTTSSEVGEARFVRCTDHEPVSVSVEITQHTRASTTASGAGKIEGTLRVLQMPWMIEVPFAIDRACSDDTE